MSLKVLHLSSGNLYGGVEVMLATLARERGHCPAMEPHFALCFPGRLSEELAALGTPATMLGPVKSRFPWQIWKVRRELRKLLSRHAFDVVVCHMPWPHAIFGPAVRQAGIPLVFWMHGPAQGVNWIERWARRCIPDLVVCNSRFTAGSRRNLFPEAAVSHAVIHCPVSNSALPLSATDRVAVRAEFSTSPDACVIIQVGRMEPCKGHGLHLEALARMADVPNWICWIVGGSQRTMELRYSDALKDRVAELGIGDRVRFLGERSDVPRLLASADVFCQPNVAPDSFGISFVEALNAGLPVVTSALGGALEIVDERCGRMVAANDSGALATVLRELVANPKLRETLGSFGPHRARELTAPESVLPTLEGALSKLIKKHPETDPVLAGVF